MNIEEIRKNEILNTIKRIDSFELRKMSIQEIMDELKPLFKDYRMRAPSFNSGQYLFRGRICGKPKGLHEIIFPPSAMIKEYGRINDIGEQVFYTATARSVPFFELNAKIGDTVVIGTWKSKSQMLLNHVGFTDECKTLLNSNRSLGTIYNFVKEMEHFGELNTLIHSYLASKFVSSVNRGDEYKYKLTIAIGRKLLAGDFIHGLMYPTIAMSANADNIALKPEFFNDNIEFVSVEYAIITERVGSQYSFDVTDSATTVNEAGNFLWSGRHLRWVLTEKNDTAIIKKEAGGLVAYDQFGKRIDPV